MNGKGETYRGVEEFSVDTGLPSVSDALARLCGDPPAKACPAQRDTVKSC